MATRIVVFPVVGRRWAFHALGPSDAHSARHGAGSLTHLWHRLRETEKLADRAELVTHYVSDKMHEKWVALGKAPSGSIRSRVHSIGQRLLARLEPSETFLKTVPRDATKVEIVFPSSFNPRLVRRRVRHVAISGTIFHRRYMYGSFALLPFTTLLGVLPLPNVALFWNLFRAHAHWRALQGSSRLLLVIEDDSEMSRFSYGKSNNITRKKDFYASKNTATNSEGNGNTHKCHLVLLPSKKLEGLVGPMQVRTEAIGDSTIDAVCQEFNLDSTQILKWRDHR